MKQSSETNSNHRSCTGNLGSFSFSRSYNWFLLNTLLISTIDLPRSKNVINDKWNMISVWAFASTRLLCASSSKSTLVTCAQTALRLREANELGEQLGYAFITLKGSRKYFSLGGSDSGASVA